MGLGLSVTLGGTVTVTVGDGGTGPGLSLRLGHNPGQDSVFGTLTACKGGGGGGIRGGASSNGTWEVLVQAQLDIVQQAVQQLSAQSGDSGNYGFGNVEVHSTGNN